MSLAIRPVRDDDQDDILRVFNYFAVNSFAAYPSQPVGSHLFERFKSLADGYPFLVIENDASEEIIGFGLLHRYHPADSFDQTAEVTYFILPEYTGHGLGQRLLDTFITHARSHDISILLASISSLNEQSLKFHAKNGFSECGRLRRIGRKHDHDFDVVWVQKFL